MSAQKADVFSSQPVIPAQKLVTLTSQSWSLVRSSLKESILTLVLPIILLGAGTLLMSLPASLPFLTASKIAGPVITLLCMLAGLITYFVGMFGLLFSWCLLLRFFYSAIVNEKPLSLKACRDHLLANWQSLTLTGLTVLALFSVLLIVGFLVFFIGTLVTGAVFSNFITIQQDNLLKAIMAVIFLLVWGFIVMTLLIGMMTLCSALSAFPFAAIATHPDRRPPWWPTVKQSIRLTFNNFTRLVGFGILFFLFTLVVSVVLNSPIFIWTVLELMRLGLSKHQALPFHLQVGSSLWHMLVQFILMPLYASAWALIWYDCQVRKEGLDLRLWLQRLIQRRQKTSKAFLSDS